MIRLNLQNSVRENGGCLPLRNGTRSTPSSFRPCGGLAPAAVRNVGKKSIPMMGCADVFPSGTTPGQASGSDVIDL